MGQNLSEPKTEKETSECSNVDFVVGHSSMQGWRPHMEDACSVQLPLDSHDPHSAYFAVFDGHGSQHFSAHCGKELHKLVLQSQRYDEGEYESCLKDSFHSLDITMQEDKSLHLQYGVGGTTAVVVVVKDKHIFCANAGDSRAIACVDGRVRELSHDHKPTLPEEERRIYHAGGWVEFNRVNGNLALSRALGDFEFKRNKDLTAEEQIVTADPEVISQLVGPDYEFLVIACDGVWDVMTNEEVVQFVRSRIAEKIKPPEICEALLDHCLAPDCRMGGVGCDNMTAIIACFLHAGTYEQLAQKCSQSLVPINAHLQNKDHTVSPNNTLLYSKVASMYTETTPIKPTDDNSAGKTCCEEAVEDTSITCTS